MIGLNFSTDRAKKPVKTSLDTGGSQESNERDKNSPSPLKFFRKSHTCAFALLMFWKFSEKVQKLVQGISFSLFSLSRFFPYADV